jgi:hypothetical protein
MEGEMMVQLVRLDEAKRPAFEALLAEIWQQTWPDDLAQQIVQWRYYERPDTADTWLAIDHGRCIGMLDSMLRPYLLDGQRILVRETADWYCTPSYRASGVGLKLLWCMRRYAEPMFVVGGSSSSRNLLTKMRWSQLSPSGGFVLPITARGLLAILLRTTWWPREKLARMVPRMLPARNPRRIKSPNGQRATVRVLAPTDPLSLLPYPATGLIQVFEPVYWDWLRRMPEALARPFCHEFFLDGVLVGVSVAQVEPAATGIDGKILHVHVVDPGLTAWVISETTQFLIRQHVGFIRCCVSAPYKVRAMQQVGYIKVHDLPCYWQSSSVPAPAALDIDFLRGDDAIPYRILRGRQLARLGYKQIDATGQAKAKADEHAHEVIDRFHASVDSPRLGPPL